MYSITENLSQESFQVILMSLATLRIYLEMMGLFKSEMPSAKWVGAQNSKGIHRFGLYMSAGYLLTFGVSYLFS